ncbi:hypothetical protein [Candidatus Tisiphia endosymbiont of Parasteatoda lunata]|uniref:hypothetical protein n=1 Tax=Candidatus Tisiphia endosymbiont of Parasteatoda lunata TaxID=3066275 RepID=UPI003977745A
MSQHKKNISVKCKILLKNILSFLDKIFKIYVETTHCKCGVFLPKWDNKVIKDKDAIEQEIDYLNFVTKELKTLDYQVGEEEKLTTIRRSLQNRDKEIQVTQDILYQLQ